MPKDYYVILGVSTDATQDEIKSAFRREAKRCHPDCSGEDSEPFLEVREAYEVLSDPRRREAHDAELAWTRRNMRWPTRAPGVGPSRRGRPPIEPVVPNRRRGYANDLGASFASLIAEMLNTPTWPDTGRGAEEIHLEVLLTREQVLHGGRLRLWVPMPVRCPACHGLGGDGFFECRHCLNSGAVLVERPVDVMLPRGVGDGLVARVPLRLPGMRDLDLVLHFAWSRRS